MNTSPRSEGRPSPSLSQAWHALASWVRRLGVAGAGRGDASGRWQPQRRGRILGPMHSRRTFSWMLASTALAFALAPGLSASADDHTYDKLFFIQRSKNANEVHYDARVNKDGTLDAKEPVAGYWLNKAEDSSRSSIGMLQKIAYGFDVDPAANGTYTMKLKAFKERPLTLIRVNNRWRAQVQIGGKQAYMTKLYVATDESGVMPKVLYTDIFGEEVNGGAPVQEHLVKN